MNQNRGLVIVASSGPDNMGYVLGHIYVDDEEQALDIAYHRRGELYDAMNLFMDGNVPDDISVEGTTEEEFYECYGNRMPLHNECTW